MVNKIEMIETELSEMIEYCMKNKMDEFFLTFLKLKQEKFHLEQ